MGNPLHNERKKAVQSAKQKATKKFHVMGNTEWNGLIGVSKCKLCGDTIHFTTNPEPNAPNAIGDALTFDCPQRKTR